MEILDVINENDEVIGQATREECHRDPTLLHRTVHFTLVNRLTGEVLLTQRSFSKTTDPGKITIMGEHVQSGETYADALKRGMQEELGFTPKKYTELAAHHFSFETQSEIAKLFLVDYQGEKYTLAKDELKGGEWVKITELQNWGNKVSDICKYWLQVLVDTNMTT